MRVLVFDLETQGFRPGEDRITEVGMVLWCTQKKKPLFCGSTLCYREDYPKQSAEILRVTGITDEELIEFGEDPVLVLSQMEAVCKEHRAEALCGHNVVNFDRPFLLAWAEKLGVAMPTLAGLPVLDTRNDLPFPTEPDSRKLKHLIADHGFLNPFPHRALFDSLSTAKLLSFYDVEKVLALAKVPFVTMRAMVSYDQKELAKAQRYMWEKAGEKSFPKCWVKLVRETQVADEIEICKKNGFQSVRIA